MQKLKSRLLASVLVSSVALLTSSCGSLEKSAQEKLENGDFDAALSLYERAAKNDPNNPEVQEGLKRARQGYIGNKLIEVRRYRSSGNSDQALETLKTVMDLESGWKTGPAAAAKYTQDEETGYAWKPFQEKIYGAIQSKQPLAAEYSLRRYSPVFSDAKYAKGVRAMNSDVVTSGKTQCSKLAKDADDELPYYAGFVARFCRHFKSQTRVAVNEAARLGELYSGVEWEGSIAGMPSDYTGYFKTSWEEALKSSPWYDAKGKRRVKVKAGGNFSYDHQKVLVSRVHSYQEDEKYDTVENIVKTRQVPVTSVQWEKDPTDGLMKPKNVTSMKNESYEEPTKVTKSRKVDKQYPYNALFHTHAIAISQSFDAMLGDKSLSFTDSDHTKIEGDEQTIKRDEIGLKPMAAPDFNPNTWVKGQSEKAQKSLASLFARQWVDVNCASSAKGTSLAENGNYVLRCARDPGNVNSGIVNEWYKTAVGLASTDAEALFAQK